MDASVDQVIGSYRLEALTGRGSMADVCAARHVKTGEPAALDHPHIARIYEFVVGPQTLIW